MHPLLLKVLRKAGVADIMGLSEDEKKDFDRWDKILSEGDITVDKILVFCQAQVIIIETQWKNLDNSHEKNSRLIVLHTVYSSIITVIKSPQTERENLEKYLNTLV